MTEAAAGSMVWVRPPHPGPRVHATVEELAAEVADGDTISLGGFHFCRQPVRLAAAVAAAGTRRLRHVQWGGSVALEVLLAAGAVEHLTFCFSNLDVFGLAPRFRRALEDGTVTHVELTALELHHAVLAAQMNLERLPLQVPAGSWRAAAYGGGDVGDSPPLRVDTVLLHAQRADELGNVELEGPLGFDVTLGLAARRVLVTVEEIVPAGGLRGTGAVLPRQFVTGIAVAPGGAWPTSCPGWYAPDYAYVNDRVQAGELPFGEGGPPEPVRRVAQVDWTRQPWPAPPPAPGTAPPAGPAPDPAPAAEDGVDSAAADLMVVWLARKLDDASVCSVGAVSPLPTTAYLLAKHTHAPRLTIISASGCCIDVAPRFMSLSFGEAADVRSAATLCGGDDSYRWYYQQGRVSHEVVSAAQIDARGRTNNSWIERPDGRRLRLPGQGGMADVANMHRNFVLYATRQSARQLVEEVDWVSSARAVSTPADRQRLGYGPGDVELLTDLGVFVLDPASGRFVLTSVHPWAHVRQIRERTGFDFAVSPDLRETPPVTPAERAALDRVDPFGVRRLEFTPAARRHTAIDAVLRAERHYLESL